MISISNPAYTTTAVCSAGCEGWRCMSDSDCFHTDFYKLTCQPFGLQCHYCEGCYNWGSATPRLRQMPITTGCESGNRPLLLYQRRPRSRPSNMIRNLHLKGRQTYHSKHSAADETMLCLPAISPELVVQYPKTLC